MPIKHLLLAVLVALIWGVNFILIKLSLEECSPLLLGTLRFFLASVPAIFFIKPPAIPFKVVALYGFVMFVLQFSFLFVGMHAGMTPGMASLIMQVQIFFSMMFAAFFLGEQPNSFQVVGALVSFLGIGLVALHFDKNISFVGFVCILAAAASWGLGNLISKKNQSVNMFSLVIWGCFVATFPMLLLTLVFEGVDSLVASYARMTWIGTASLFYTVYLSTLVGYGLWNWLLSRYRVGTIVPFTLLVPVVGILSSVLILGEPFQHWKVVAGLLVIAGLYINLRGAKYFKKYVKEDLLELNSSDTHTQNVT